MTKIHDGEKINLQAAVLMAQNVNGWNIKDKKGLRKFSGTLDGLTITLERNYPYNNNQDAMLKVHYKDYCLYEGSSNKDPHNINYIYDSVEKNCDKNDILRALNHAQNIFNKYFYKSDGVDDSYEIK